MKQLNETNETNATTETNETAIDNGKENTATENELDLDLWDIADSLDFSKADTDIIATMISESLFDLSHEIKFDGTKEDNKTQERILKRLPVVNCFLSVALDYIRKVQNDIDTNANDLRNYMRNA